MKSLSIRIDNKLWRRYELSCMTKISNSNDFIYVNRNLFKYSNWLADYLAMLTAMNNTSQTPIDLLLRLFPEHEYKAVIKKSFLRLAKDRLSNYA